MNFELVKLGEVAKFIRGVSYKPNDLVENFSENSIVCMRTANVQKKLDETDMLSIPLTIVKDKTKYLQEGDILVSTANSWNLVGKCSWIPKLEYLATAGGFISILRADDKKIDRRYLYHWFNSDRTQIQARNCGRQTTNISNMDLDRALSLKIPLPPLSEQKRIADILDKADELRQKRQQSIEKLDELLQATFIDMFGDPVTNPKGWDVEKLDNLMTIVRGGSPRPIEKFLGGDYPWIKIGDATKGDDLYISKTKESITEAGLKKTRLLPEGSLIFANCGVSLGFARILKIQGCIHDGWLAFQNIDEERVNKIFLLKALNSVTQFFRDTAPDGTQPNLNTAIMKEFKLIIPPMIEQLKFEQIVYSINEQKEKLINQLFNQEYLFQSLQQRAFNGEL